VDQGTLAKWERGEREPMGEFVKRAPQFLAATVSRHPYALRCFQSLAKNLSRLGEWNGPIKPDEAAFLRSFSGGSDESSPGGFRKGGSDADPSYSHFREIRYHQTGAGAHKDVDWLWRE
jgi:hypothetical protein